MMGCKMTVGSLVLCLLITLTVEQFRPPGQGGRGHLVEDHHHLAGDLGVQEADHLHQGADHPDQVRDSDHLHLMADQEVGLLSYSKILNHWS